MKGLKVYDLSKFSKEEAKEIVEISGVNIAGDFVYVDKTSAKLIEKIIKNRKAKSGEEERRQDVLLILSTYNHKSLENYPYFMNDREFLLRAVAYTPNPRVCSNYFYTFINKHLKRDKSFNYQFLSKVLEHFGIKSAEFVAEKFGLEDVLDLIKKDIYNSAPSGKVETVDYSKKTNRNY